MKTHSHRLIALVTALLIAPLSAAAPYDKDALAPLADYLSTSEDAEITLALSAAPSNVSADAEVLLLTSDGYRVARQGTNGFVCLVERSWAGSFRYVGAFWDPQIRAPICYNRHAADYVLPLYMLRTRLALAGNDRAQIKTAVDEAVSSGNLKAPTGTAMSYMMSGGQYLHPNIGRWLPHLMIWMPYTDQSDWGANQLAGDDPVVFRNPGGPFAMVVIPYGEERFIDP